MQAQTEAPLNVQALARKANRLESRSFGKLPDTSARPPPLGGRRRPLPRGRRTARRGLSPSEFRAGLRHAFLAGAYIVSGASVCACISAMNALLMGILVSQDMAAAYSGLISKTAARIRAHKFVGPMRSVSEVGV